MELSKRAVLGLACLILALAAGPLAPQAMAQDADDVQEARELGTRDKDRDLGRTGLKLPRFVSLRASEVNMRTGPGTRYPIEWIYRRRNLPVEVVDEFDTWRRIRDIDGAVGWVHQSMLQSNRAILVVEEWAMLRRDPQDDARSVARLEPGVIADLESCGDIWCVVEIDEHKGWVRRDQIYGVYPGEEVR